MALDQRFYCDRCGERIQPGDLTRLKPTTGELRLHEPFDLCGECKAQWLAWLGPAPGRKPMPAEASISAG